MNLQRPRWLQFCLRLGQLMWLGLTTLWLLGFIDFSYPFIAIILVWGSTGLIGHRLYQAIRAIGSSLSRQIMLWAGGSLILVVCLWPLMMWVSGQSPRWTNRWVWPTSYAQEGSSGVFCALQSPLGTGTGRHRFIVGHTLGPFATWIWLEHDLSFRWVDQSIDQPTQLITRLGLHQRQLGPYFNQARWHRFGLWLGLRDSVQSIRCTVGIEADAEGSGPS